MAAGRVFAEPRTRRRGLALGLAALCGALAPRDAAATRDPVPYRESLAERVAARARALNEAQRYAEARRECRRFTDAFGPSADVLYEEAYAWNMEGRLDRALDAYSAVIELDPDMVTARYDRAELLLAAGELDAAEADLAVVARARPDHWAVHLRLAEIAGRRGDARELERQLLATLGAGMDWGVLVGDPAWESLAADPTAGPVLKRLLHVYGDPAIYDQLLQGGGAP